MEASGFGGGPTVTALCDVGAVLGGTSAMLGDAGVTGLACVGAEVGGGTIGATWITGAGVGGVGSAAFA